MENYPLLDLFWTMMWLFLWILWFFLLFRILTDIFRSRDSGWIKALWTIFVIILPFLGVLVYLIARGDSMGERERAATLKAEDQFRSYVRDVATTSPTTPTDQLATLADLHKQGLLTEEEFAQQKARLLATTN
jgi:hypothetical protein